MTIAKDIERIVRIALERVLEDATIAECLTEKSVIEAERLKLLI